VARGGSDCAVDVARSVGGPRRGVTSHHALLDEECTRPKQILYMSGETGNPRRN
jgi:hypothetical protein